MQNGKSFYKEVIIDKEKKIETDIVYVECALCEKTLVKCVQILEIPKELMYIFMCPHCSGKSFKKSFKFKTLFETVDCKIENIEYSEKENLCLVKLSQLAH